MELFLETLLNEDHERIDALFEQYLERRKNKGKDALKLFGAYQDALLKHMKLEEDLIFPVLERHPKERATQEVVEMLQEHDSIRSCLAKTRGLCDGSSDDVEAAERHLFEELHEHNAREEMHVYPHLERLLTLEEASAVAKLVSP
ncbi:MAG: hemerythrin domain-containing protein [Bdellovibrionales bacterium]|nr:hemerythrin domain-containing protein [Bdellovibrionales bacterium]